ncbi:MAG: hypothetical protein N2645_11685 [Clostridia bacterium]|nr:hypothetical protein [Clostridia bacterium]
MIEEAQQPAILNEKMKTIIIKARKKRIPFSVIYEWLKEIGFNGTIGQIKWFYYKNRKNYE